MACSSCGTKSGGCSPAGCKSNGTCGTSGCNALNVYDWFKDMDLPDGYKPFDIVEVRFKGSRKEFFRNTHNLDLYTGDYVVCESSLGYDIGTVSATGEIVRLQLKKYRVREDSEDLLPILRVANEKDMEKYELAKAKENATLEKARTISFELNLAMKISDIEFQGDGRKVIFFYTAEARVDFRELIKRYAEEFKVKIEMRHISYREEASRLGGIGVCGRELCCSTWLTDYKQVNTGAARSQNLSINMEKLAGQCGRLKCCLNYELDMYLEATEAFPKAKIVKIDTVTGTAFARKTDILKQLMWFSYDDSQTWIPLPVEKVNECIESNKNGVQVPTLTDLAPANEILAKVIADEKANDFIDNAELLKDNEFEGLKKLDNNRGSRDRNNRNKNQNNRREGGQNNNQNRNHKPGAERNNKPNNGPNSNRPNPNQQNKQDGAPKPQGENTGAKPNNPNSQNRNPNPNKNRKPYNKNRGPRNNEGGANNGGGAPPTPPQS